MKIMTIRLTGKRKEGARKHNIHNLNFRRRRSRQNCKGITCAKKRETYSVFYRMLCTKLYCQVISQNVIKVTPVTY